MGYWQRLHNHISVLDHIVDHANIQICQAAVAWHLSDMKRSLISKQQTVTLSPAESLVGMGYTKEMTRDTMWVCPALHARR